ncbi:hypothetical protein HD806DRAFT_504368 [Xylariaceae sp. AK1471]|nr:hypothetical protein HD806DRAFT_504368 [Xylariaceae sp. AK1471]
MRASFSTIALCALGASAAVLPTVAEDVTRRDIPAVWYAITYDTQCGFGCFTNYVLFGGADTIPGAPAFAARCNTASGCYNTVAGSQISTSQFPSSASPLTINQTFTSGGKTVTVTGVTGWTGGAATNLIIPVTVTA